MDATPHRLLARAPLAGAVVAFALLLGASPARASDASSAPTPLAFGAAAHADLTAATIEPGEQNTSEPFAQRCGANYNVGVARTAWYSVSGTGGPVTVTTAGSDPNFDPALFVYAGSPAGNVVTCNDDTPAGIHAAVTFASALGTTYLIQVGRACNEVPGSRCVDNPTAGPLTITAIGTPPASNDPGTPVAFVPVAPENAVAPSIEGPAVAGQQLTCVRGVWTGTEPLTYDYAWLRDGTLVDSGPVRRVAAADVSHRLVCHVIAKGPGGSKVAASAPVTPVTARTVVVIRATGGIRAPAGVPRQKACRGTMALTLSKGKQVLGRKTVRLNTRCRWTWSFVVSRKRIGSTRTLSLRQRFSGNAYITAGATTRALRVPR